MRDLNELERYLTEQGARFELLRQDRPILTAADAEGLYDLSCAAVALVVRTERGLMLLIAGAGRGRLDFDALKRRLGLERLKLADAKHVERETGYAAGSIPLVGVSLPCIFDDDLLSLPCLYGGSGDPLTTLRIAPEDARRLNDVALSFSGSY